MIQAARVALVATYPPRHCGIATFSADLRAALATDLDQWRPEVVAVDRGRGDPRHYPPEVTRRLRGTDPGAYRLLADELSRDCEAVLLQHEYGIFGGPSGRHVLRLAEALTVPLVTTLHTVLAHPSGEQARVLSELVARSVRVVTMTERSRELLVAGYGASPDRIEVIPHGVPTFEPLDPATARRVLGVEGGPMILSFGLLSPGKGVELVIDALSRIRDQHPNARYVVVGQTHPEVKRRHGEQYRQTLMAQADRLRMGERVQFVDRFVPADELGTWLQACDVFVTAYPNAEQSTSGTLSLAIAAGRACVSTPYEHARELLADGRGVLVPFEDATALAGALDRLLSDPAERNRIGGRARAHASSMAWPTVADRYRAVLSAAANSVGVAEGRRAVAEPLRPVLRPLHRPAEPVATVPPVVREHRRRLSAGGGIWQHAIGRDPDPRHGTCTDDVARALMVDLAHQAEEPSTLVAGDIHDDVTYLEQAFNPATGRFRNFRAADGAWVESIGSEDAHGRALQALGVVVGESDEPKLIARARRLFEVGLQGVPTLVHARPRCYVALGCVSALRGGPDRRLRDVVERAVAELATASARTATSWPWPEPIVTYDNGILPQALIEAGAELGRAGWIAVGLRQLEWLVSAQTAGAGHLRPVGNRGWWPRGGRPARYDQQPIEAASLLEAAWSAWRVTGERRWADEMARAFRWFRGANDAGAPVADPETGACHDGLGRTGISPNCGAESTLVWLRSVERMRELRGALEFGSGVERRAERKLAAG